MTDKPPEGSPLPDPVPPPNPPVNAIPEVVPKEHIAPEMVPDTPTATVADAVADSTDSTSPLPSEAVPDAAPKATPDVAPAEPSTSVAARPPAPKPPKKAGQPDRKRQPQKPSTRPQRYRLITIASAIRSLSITFAAAVIVATIFMWWTSPDFLTVTTRQNLAPVEATARQILITPSALPTPGYLKRIGIVAGHSGIGVRGSTAGHVDPGAVCPDGFTEGSVTIKVANQVAAILRGRGYTVDVLEEYDMKLFGYQSAAFISVHAQPCEDYGYGGFAITSSEIRTTARQQDLQLDDCIRQNYAQVTGLEFQIGNITENMTDYHAFREIASTTPAVVLELGYIGHDRDMLQNHSDKLALGIVNGLRCFVEPNLPTTTTRTIPLASKVVSTPTLNPTLKP